MRAVAMFTAPMTRRPRAITAGSSHWKKSGGDCQPPWLLLATDGVVRSCSRMTSQSCAFSASAFLITHQKIGVGKIFSIWPCSAMSAMVSGSCWAIGIRSWRLLQWPSRMSNEDRQQELFPVALESKVAVQQVVEYSAKGAGAQPQRDRRQDQVL